MCDNVNANLPIVRKHRTKNPHYDEVNVVYRKTLLVFIYRLINPLNNTGMSTNICKSRVGVFHKKMLEYEYLNITYVNYTNEYININSTLFNHNLDRTTS